VHPVSVGALHRTRSTARRAWLASARLTSLSKFAGRFNMTTHQKISFATRPLCFALGLLAAACFPPATDGTSPGPVGAITFSLTAIPADARCLRVTVSNGQTLTRLFDLEPGAGALLTMDGVPEGPVTVSEAVFPTACAMVTERSAASWISERPVMATVTATATTMVSVTLRATGALRFDNNFDDSGVAVSPTTADFGGVTIGASSRALTFAVRDVGRAATGTLAATITGRDASEFVIASNACRTLAPGDMCALTVSLRPITGGAKMASLRVTASPGGEAIASLTGVGLTPAALTITPSEHDFGVVTGGATVGPFSFLVRNVGESPTGAPAVSLSATSPGGLAFAVVTSGCRVIALPPGGECVITVRATALRGGAPGTLQTALLTVDAENGVTAMSSLRLTAR
jgi:hypothetical protein